MFPVQSKRDREREKDESYIKFINEAANAKRARYDE